MNSIRLQSHLTWPLEQLVSIYKTKNKQLKFYKQNIQATVSTVLLLEDQECTMFTWIQLLVKMVR